MRFGTRCASSRCSVVLAGCSAGERVVSRAARSSAGPSLSAVPRRGLLEIITASAPFEIEQPMSRPWKQAFRRVDGSSHPDDEVGVLPDRLGAQLSDIEESRNPHVSVWPAQVLVGQWIDFVLLESWEPVPQLPVHPSHGLRPRLPVAAIEEIQPSPNAAPTWVRDLARQVAEPGDWCQLVLDFDGGVAARTGFTTFVDFLARPPGVAWDDLVRMRSTASMEPAEWRRYDPVPQQPPEFHCPFEWSAGRSAGP